MWKIKNKRTFIALFLYGLTFGITPQVLAEEVPLETKYEEAIITLSANKSIYNKEIFAFIKNGEEMPLISLDDFMNSIGITEYELVGSKIKYQFNGEKVLKRIETVSIYDTVAIKVSEVENLLDVESLEWSPLKLNLKLKTNKMLPNEYLKYREDKRKNLLNNKEENVIEEEWKVFTPGILSLGYSKSNIKKDASNLYLNYNNHLLYGNFTMDLSYTHNENYDNLKVNTINWKRDVLDERNLILGDTYLRKNYNIGENSSIIGLNLGSKNSWDSSLDVNKKTIRGTAPSGTIVELYENGILRDYLEVKGGEYNFPIETKGGNRTYEVWLYNADGSIEKKKISLYGNNNFVEAGKFDYDIQVGQEEEHQEFLYNANIYYGVTENLTLGIGGANALSNEYNLSSKKNDYLNTSFLQSFSTQGRWSSLIGGSLIFNSEDTEEKFYQVEGQVSSDKVTHLIGIENYKDLDSDFYTETYDEKLYLRSNFSLFNANASLSYENEKGNQYEEVDRYGASIYGTLIRGKVSTSINYTYENIEEKNGIKSDYDKLGVSFSYYISNPVYRRFMETVTVDYQTSNFSTDSYGIRFYKNKGNNSLDYSLGYRVSKNEKDLIEFSFSYTFGDALELRSRSTSTSESTTTNFSAHTNVNFGMDQKLRKNRTSGKSNVKGRVYIDTNSNGIFDYGDEIIEDVSITSSGTQTLSDENGYYELPLITPKYKQEIKIRNKNQSLFGSYIFPEKYNIKTLPGGVLKLDIPVSQVKTIIGTFDFNRDFYLEDVNDFLSSVKLSALNLQSNKITPLEVSNETIIQDIPQGKYLISIEYFNADKKLEKEEFIVDISQSDDFESYLDFEINKEKRDEYKVSLKVNDKVILSEKEKKLNK